MDKQLQEIIDRLRSGITSIDQSSLFGADPKELLNACVDYVRHYGYSVTKPINYPIKITKADDLIALFYLLFNKHYPTFAAPYNSESRDRKIAKLFIDSRMKADGISRAKALEQCAAIIETVFKNKDNFNFDPYPTFGVFGQQKMGWITEKALGFVNKDLEKFKEIETDKKIEDSTAKLEASGMQIGWGDDVIE